MFGYYNITQPPYSRQPLLPLPQESPLLLPPHVVLPRSAPSLIEYRGIPLYYSFDKTGRTIWISFREPKVSSKRCAKIYGRILIKRAYRVQGSVLAPDELVRSTLDQVFDRFLFPSLIKVYPDLLSPATRFDAAAPLAMQRLEKMKLSAKTDNAALSELLRLFGDKQIDQMTPSYCAPVLNKSLSRTKSNDCLKLLRKIYQYIFMDIAHETSFQWVEYKLPHSRRAYDAQRAIRSEFLHIPLTKDQLLRVLERCKKNTKNGTEKEKKRYLAAALMILLHLSPAELCAMTTSAKHNLPYHPDISCLDVQTYQETEGRRKKLKADGSKRIRERKKTVNEYDDKFNKYAARCLPLGKLLDEMWRDCFKNSRNGEQLYLLCNPRNYKRMLSVEDFEDWLDQTFADIVDTSGEFMLPKGVVCGKYRVSDFFLCTAHHSFVNGMALPEEFVRSLCGKPPLACHTDATNYVDYQCEAGLINAYLSINRYTDMLFGTVSSLQSKRKKVFGAPPGECEILKIQLISAENAENESLESRRIRVLIPYGGVVIIKYYPL